MSKPSYKGTQQNLYTLSRLAWGYCLEFITAITAAKPLYTPTFIAAQLTKVDTAEALPDYGNRKDIPKEAYGQMKSTRLAVLAAWQLLKEYIESAFPPELIPSKLYAAGQGYYPLALGGSLDNTAALILAAKQFMTTNSVALLADNNMPAGFQASFDTLSTSFTTLRTTYFGKEDLKYNLTNDKDAADAAILKTLRPMLALGRKVYKDDPDIRPKFIYNWLLDQVRGNHPSGLKGIFTKAGTTQPIAGVTIRAIDTEYTTQSDVAGRYELLMASGKYNIEISAPGYQTVVINDRKIDVGVKHRLSLALEAAPTAMSMLTNEMLNEMMPSSTPAPVNATNGVQVEG